jgi:hypothetical protein
MMVVLMQGRRSIIVVENFYTDPDNVRKYALKQNYYNPYQPNTIETPHWSTTWYRPWAECPFKQSPSLLPALEQIVGETIDRVHWQNTYPTDEESKPIVKDPRGREACLWNCSFHVKFDSGQRLGMGVHNHVTDGWNSVGEDGWAGIIYLGPAPLAGGLHLWKNIDHARRFDWMTPPSNWNLVDRFGNIANRLLLCRGDLPHSGANGWGDSIETGRMFQTFFFKTVNPRSYHVMPPV